MSQATVITRIEKTPLSPSDDDHSEFTISEKEEPVVDGLIPELGISNLLSSIFLPVRCL
jgi:hypothetical protein